jgi:hypothetical protein
MRTSRKDTRNVSTATDQKRSEYLTFCQLQVLYLIAFPASNSICFPIETLASVESSASAFSPAIDLVIGPSMRFILRPLVFLPPFSAAVASAEKTASLPKSLGLAFSVEGEDEGLELSLFFLPKPNAI